MSAPPQPHSETDSRQQNPYQFSSIRNRDKTRLLAADLDHAGRHSSYSASASTAFTASLGIAYASGASTRSEGVRYLRNWNDCLFVRRNGFAVDGLHACLAKNTFLQRLQKSQTAHRGNSSKENIILLGAWCFSFICGNLSLDLGVHLQKDVRMRWPRRNLRLLSVALEEPCRERWIARRCRGEKQLQTPPLPWNPRESETH